MATTAQTNKKALFSGLLGYIIWGCSFLFTRMALQVLPMPTVLLAIRFLLAFIVMNLMVLCGLAKVNFRGKKLRALLILAVSEPICFFFESYGILYTNATFAGAMSAASPIAAILMAAAFLGERPTKRMLVWCFLPIVGVIITTVAGENLGIAEPIGVLCLLGLCFSTGAYRTANRSSSQEFTPFERFYAVLAACTIAFTPIGLIQMRGHMEEVKLALTDGRFLFALVMLILFCSLAANILVNYGAGYLSVATMATMSAIQTVCATVTGVLILGEPMTLPLLVGTALIVFGVYRAAREGN